MAKNDIKSYVISRLKTLKKELDKNVAEGGNGKDEELRIKEVKNMASNFGVRTKDIEAALQK